MIDEIAQIAGGWGVVIANDLPSPDQLHEIECDGWKVTQIIPHFPGSKQVPPGSVAIYMRSTEREDVRAAKEAISRLKARRA